MFGTPGSQPATSGLFGSQQQSTAGQSTGLNLQTSTATSSPFGSFGANKPATSSPFGAFAAPTASTSATSSPFGNLTASTSVAPTSIATSAGSLTLSTNNASTPFGSFNSTTTKPAAPSLFGAPSSSTATSGGIGALTTLANSTSQPPKQSAPQPSVVTAATLTKNTRFSDLPDQAKNTLEEIEKFIQKQVRTNEQISVQRKTLAEQYFDDVNVASDAIATIRVSLQNDFHNITQLRREVDKNYQFMIKTAQLMNAMRDGQQRVYNSAFLSSYFDKMADVYEIRIKQYAQAIDEIQQHLMDVAHTRSVSPQALSEAMRFQIDTLVSLAGKVAEIHQQVKEMKSNLLSESKYYQNGASDPFAQARVLEAKNKTKSILSTEEETPSRYAQIAMSTVQPLQQQQNMSAITMNSSVQGTGFGASTGGGLFGNKPASNGLFGSSNMGIGTGLNLAGSTTNTGGGLFGAASQSQPSGGLFGQSQPNNAGSTGGGLFGNKPAGGGLFGGSNASTGLNLGGSTMNSGTGLNLGGNTNTGGNTGGGLFGAASQAQPSGGLFGASQAQNSGGLFGQSQQNNTGFTGGLFGTPAQSQSQPSGGLFGSTTQSQNSGSPFGAPSQPQQQNSGFGGFGTPTKPFGQ